MKSVRAESNPRSYKADALPSKQRKKNLSVLHTNHKKSGENFNASFLIPVPVISNLPRMISDVQLAIFANVLGVSLFLLVVLYHYIAANYSK
ncbi:hypothetical protein M8J77_014633 [Diaphorina citri]|nr:hypothetical protein M8J77_014633 [Diaphorina citri]